MTGRRTPMVHPSLAERLLLTGLTLGGLAYVLLADYPPQVLGVLLAMIFGIYFSVRVLIYWDNDGFSPKRIRVGMRWVLLGLDADTEEFDAGPVRVYAAILLLLLTGLIVRPMAQWLVFGTEG